MSAPMRPALRHARGFSLIELMIAMVIGLVVIAGVASVFVSSRQSFRTQESMAQVQESGRFLGYVMYPYVRLAGFLPDPLNQVNPPAIYVGDPVNMAIDDRRAVWGVNNAAGGAIAVFGGTITPKAGTDVLVVRYVGQNSFGVATGDGQMRTCQNLGNSDGVANANYIKSNEMAEDIYYISAAEVGIGTSVQGLSNLNCRAVVRNATTGLALAPALGPVDQPVANGVQDMQVLYGVNTDNDGAPNIYRTAAQVTDWTRVVSIRITTTIESAEASENTRPTATATVQGGATTGEVRIAQGRVRRTYQTTILVRNKLST